MTAGHTAPQFPWESTTALSGMASDIRQNHRISSHNLQHGVQTCSPVVFFFSNLFKIFSRRSRPPPYLPDPPPAFVAVSVEHQAETLGEAVIDTRLQAASRPTRLRTPRCAFAAEPLGILADDPTRRTRQALEARKDFHAGYQAIDARAQLAIPGHRQLYESTNAYPPPSPDPPQPQNWLPP
ncbi:hypothetical protein G7046_g9329 [Stylonectria norvegica]|nr:hypothetical protein G7046_g9329 [Stylonectria norvegica]